VYHKLATLLGIALALVMAATPAHAITWGQVDGNRHPNVGAVVVNDTRFGEQILGCSGTLIAPTIFLTAAHCIVGSIREDPEVTFVGVTFDPQFESDGTVPDHIITGQMIAHPDYRTSTWPLYDIGVIVLDEPVTGVTPAQLPPAQFLDSVKTARGQKTVTFTIVGYGTAILTQGGPHQAPYGTRQFATTHLLEVNNARTGNTLFTMTNAPGTGGGSCYGDSGGPVFLGTTNMLVGVHILGNGTGMCRGFSWEYRLDTAEARAFLSQFVALP
jgi:V8-like Glu-specific endopeptidase